MISRPSIAISPRLIASANSRWRSSDQQRGHIAPALTGTPNGPNLPWKPQAGQVAGSAFACETAASRSCWNIWPVNAVRTRAETVREFMGEY
jgi:hypothetical protein